MKNITIPATLATISLLLTSGFLLPSQASNTPLQLAQEPNCKTPLTTFDMTVCYGQDFQVADRKLNQVYQQLQQKLNSKQQERLTVAQLSWIEFRDKSCDFARGRVEGGTLAGPIYILCKLRVTQERIKDLEYYLQEGNL
ncbi:MAG: DUF1311 domain-containing protein [Oscillatoriales cyanobacterium]|uniref:Lysozyme inhibitor LprI family protein n=1 Tax=Microcoleus anatoxicus PTRS2 TaxID=2705321 RepID=A0ABU8YM44_9CYAN|nr:MAG: DUF1311 domain-containing protein [Oscillatoriales cyanobacterium]TAD96051.1 MAG: DUF1311 domain-containing protein [Oscillatoriales cyanobacterium]TAE02457.1 MAG: DUF1311 domain-containing protein [Oscillatoriales cyanobacterium]TAF06860.1 MAG: DUF1311 domain-containing protein [Oscillatoriales cyanobacterium]TAF61035.1 MAG: DUF1311 domain-containing protein [Oscillatoriales cyanobacterium]